METKKDYVNRIFREAMVRGLCSKQKEFAALLGMDPSTVSNALKGNEKYLTDSIVRRVRAWEEQVLGKKTEDKPEAPAQPDIVIPAATATLYNNMSETIRIQAEIIARLQGSATAPTYTQKNYLRDGE